jgi:formate C-acetyltransferase
LEHLELPPYHGEPLYPCGAIATRMCVRHGYSFTVDVDWDQLEQKDAAATEALRAVVSLYEPCIPWEHTVDGRLYTHSFPNFHRIAREGLHSYRKRIEQMQDETLRQGLLDVWEGIAAFHKRALTMLREKNAPRELCQALERVPFSPAETLYEAMVCRNFIYYMDGCDDVGRLDADLIAFYRGEDITELFRTFYRNVDANNGWSGALGPDYNPLTLQALRAAAGMRRPSIELRITPDMPQEIWDAAIQSICAGGGSPALYNEAAYQSSLAAHFPQIPKSDLLQFCGGGCTETMLTGISHVGSLDAGINLALIFERVMQKSLPTAPNFEAFYQDYLQACRTEITHVLHCISQSQMQRAKYRPQPMRTFLIDDCIEKERDFNDGGARYDWSVVNLAGMINVLDSLLMIRALVFESHEMTAKELLDRLAENSPVIRRKGIAQHGTNSADANALAKRFSHDVCEIFEGETPWSGGRFLPSSIQFTTYTDAGRAVGATPDGRQKVDPLCDSIGAIHGNDTRGVTCMLNSAAALCQEKLLGTPILNVRMGASDVKKTLRALAEGYFAKGGMQMQITCVNHEELLDAQKHPERYPNLIVRVGGYAEYFARLSPTLQQTVIERTICRGES